MTNTPSQTFISAARDHTGKKSVWHVSANSYQQAIKEVTGGIQDETKHDPIVVLCLVN
jgi:hypothetical protein